MLFLDKDKDNKISKDEWKSVFFLTLEEFKKTVKEEFSTATDDQLKQ